MLLFKRELNQSQRFPDIPRFKDFPIFLILKIPQYSPFSRFLEIFPVPGSPLKITPRRFPGHSPRIPIPRFPVPYFKDSQLGNKYILEY